MTQEPTTTNGNTRILTLLVAVLTAAVVIQSVYLAKVYKQTQSTPQVAAAAVHSSPSARPGAPASVPPSASTSTPPSATTTPGGSIAAPGQTPGQPLAQAPLSDPFEDAWSDWDTGDWDPFAEMQRVRKHMSHLFDDSFNRFRQWGGTNDSWMGMGMTFSPQTDLKDEDGQYVVRFDIPGAEKSKIKVSVDDRQLTVSGSTEETVENKDGNRVLRRERRSGQFARSITLPGPVDADKVSAKYEDGVLIVTVPKSGEAPGSKTIKIL